MAVQSHQERNDQPQPDWAVESFDLPLLEATLVEEPSEVEVQPVGPIYDAIYVSDNHQLESQPYWKRHQKSLFVAVLLIICILLATMIGVLVSNGTQNSSDSRNPQQLAESALDYGATTESVADPLDSADEENESKVVLANSSHTSLPHAVIESPQPTESMPSPSPSLGLNTGMDARSKEWLEAHNTRRQYYHELIYVKTSIPLSGPNH
jgi:hypothetical protein